MGSGGTAIRWPKSRRAQRASRSRRPRVRRSRQQARPNSLHSSSPQPTPSRCRGHRAGRTHSQETRPWPSRSATSSRTRSCYTSLPARAAPREWHHCRTPSSSTCTPIGRASGRIRRAGSSTVPRQMFPSASARQPCSAPSAKRATRLRAGQVLARACPTLNIVATVSEMRCRLP